MSFDLVSLGSNLGLLDELLARYERDRRSVDPSWNDLFANGEALAKAYATGLPAPRILPEEPLPASERPLARAAAAQPRTKVMPAAAGQNSVWPLVNAYRVRGHLLADLDPLDMLERPRTVELEPQTYGFSDDDLDVEMPAGGLYGVERATLREILAKLRQTYSSSIGLEFMHISTPVKKAWLAQRMETRDRHPVDRETQLAMLEAVIAAENFERFCHVKFPGTKRFSLEGSEGLIPLLDLVLLHAGRLGAFEAVFGMAHRGRLNVLANILGRKLRDVFAEFEDIEPEATLGGGDVKYHLGYSSDRVDRHGRTLHVSLTFNPSHLEAVDPVVVGRVRAKQRRHHDWEHRRVVGILIHGDAAFAGQGLVAETLNLTNLHGFRTGGTVHIIVNNQIGFTASPHEARSTPYCTDLAKMIQCPIFHVNGEDLDAIAQVVEMALEYRAEFQSDVVIDMFCYRKFGHNEMDEPSFTQPLMYRRIQEKQPPDVLYAAGLIERGVITSKEIEAIRERKRQELETELAAARAAEKRPRIEAMRGVWSGYIGGPEANVPDVDTGVARSRLLQIAERITSPPEGLHVHPKVERLLQQRAEMGRGDRPLDWGMAELLAYGSLLWEGTNVRLSGQDSSRGTFSHRHALLTDVDTGTEYMPLCSLHPEQGECRIYDSPLSEAGVLGFEFGYSLDYPDALVIWEAQFGDFANGGQVIIDQFIIASEDKWNRLAGLVLFLPHGFEGQGPEHSSARLERFLQSAAEDNMQICQPTTPAQMFHLLRRQVIRPWRKPLICLTPKSLLRLPAAQSALEELETGRFRRMLADPSPPAADDVERIFLCSGKIFYELMRERTARGDLRTAILRIEQFFPWRPEELVALMKPFSRATELVWIQDEPSNMGAACFLEPRLAEIFPAEGIRLVSRPESASPATGSGKAHLLEHEMLMNEAFDGVAQKNSQGASG